MHWLGVLGLIAVPLLAAAFLAAVPVPPLPNEAQADGYRFGLILAFIGIPGLIAYLAAGRKKVRSLNRFAAIFSIIGIALIGLNFAQAITSGAIRGFETTDQKISRLMREAGGAQPVHKSLFGESPVDTTLRDMFTELIAYNKDYTAAAAKVDLSKVRLLNTAQAFADPDSVAEGLRELHAANDLDALEAQRMQQIIQKYRARFAAISPHSDSLVSGFDKGLAQSDTLRSRAVSGEQAWLSSVDQVYDYARAHHSSFKVVNGHLVILDHLALLQFNSRVHTMNQSRVDFLAAKKQLDDYQHSTLQKFGLTPQQTGRSSQ